MIPQGTVAARIQKLESAAPIVYPLHVNRFKRRTSCSALVKPDNAYDKNSTSRTRAILPEPRALTPPQLKTSRRVPPTLFSPADFLHGTIDRCVRHGRKPGITGDGLEKGRNGAYYPTGLSNRRNVEATSPWAGRSDNACPDCVAEIGYKRREQLQTIMRPEKSREPSPAQSVATTAQSEEFGFPLRPVAKLVAPEVVAPAPKSHHWLPEWLHGPEHRSSSRHDDSTLIQHLNASSPETNTSDNLVTTEDLGDGLDAAIFERHGRLERVVLNRRHGEASTAGTILRLSKDLFAVAQTLQKHLDPSGYQNAPVINVEKPNPSQSSAASDIRKAPNPYFHAPSEPRSLHYAQWLATKALEKKPHVQVSLALHIPTEQNNPPASPRLIATPDLTPSLRSTPALNVVPGITSLVSDIRKHPNPYFHAPPEPRSLHFAKWADKQVQAMQQGFRDAAKMEEQKVMEAQQMVTDGFRMERTATLEQAAEWEKKFRRQSASGSAKPGRGIRGIFT